MPQRALSCSSCSVIAANGSGCFCLKQNKAGGQRLQQSVQWSVLDSHVLMSSSVMSLAGKVVKCPLWEFEMAVLLLEHVFGLLCWQSHSGRNPNRKSLCSVGLWQSPCPWGFGRVSSVPLLLLHCETCRRLPVGLEIGFWSAVLTLCKQKLVL